MGGPQGNRSLYFGDIVQIGNGNYFAEDRSVGSCECVEKLVRGKVLQFGKAIRSQIVTVAASTNANQGIFPVANVRLPCEAMNMQVYFCRCYNSRLFLM